MNPEWIVVGIVLLGAMAAGGTNLYIKRRKEAQMTEHKTISDLPESDTDES